MTGKYGETLRLANRFSRQSSLEVKSQKQIAKYNKRIWEIKPELKNKIISRHF